MARFQEPRDIFIKNLKGGSVTSLKKYFETVSFNGFNGIKSFFDYTKSLSGDRGLNHLLSEVSQYIFIHENSMSIVNYLLDEGVGLESLKDEHASLLGKLAVMKVSPKRREEWRSMIWKIIDSGIETLEDKDRYGHTPLMRAVANEENFKLLVQEFGCSIPDDCKISPALIHYALNHPDDGNPDFKFSDLHEISKDTFTGVDLLENIISEDNLKSLMEFNLNSTIENASIKTPKLIRRRGPFGFYDVDSVTKSQDTTSKPRI